MAGEQESVEACGEARRFGAKDSHLQVLRLREKNLCNRLTASRDVTKLDMAKHVAVGRPVLNDATTDEWGGLPLLLTVDEAARLLRISRSKAYEMAKAYTASGGTAGLSVLRLGDLLCVPRFALHEFVTTGHIVQLIPQPEQHETDDVSPSRKPARARRATARTQLSLLGSD